MGISYEVKEHIAVLSEEGDVSKEFNLVAWNGAAPKYDLRSWRRADGEERPLKGLTLSAEELEALREAIEGR